MKKSEFESKRKRPDYIDWQEFNELVKARGDVPPPNEDSKDDSALDELEEIEMGEDFPEERREQKTNRFVRADTPSPARDKDNLYEDVAEITTAEVSPRPSPRHDKDSESSTH